MRVFDLTLPHALGVDEARKRVEGVAAELHRDGFEWRREGDLYRWNGKGAQGTAHVTASDVTIHVELPALLGGLQGAVEKRIREKLEPALRKAASVPPPAKGAAAPIDFPDQDTLPDLPGLREKSLAFRRGLVVFARDAHMPPDELAAVLEIASGIMPGAEGVSGMGLTGGKGLLAWQPITHEIKDGKSQPISKEEQEKRERQRYGATVNEIASHGAEGQLWFVWYWAKHAPTWRLPGDVYVAHVWPSATGKPGGTVIAKKGSIVYDSQPKLDTSRDGVLTASDIREALLWRLGETRGKRLDARDPSSAGAALSGVASEQSGDSGPLGGILIAILGAFVFRGMRAAR